LPVRHSGRGATRVTPGRGPTTRRGPLTWLFSTDPKDQGEKELRYSIGYNIENQMTQMNATRSWTGDSRFANYAGVAWYRTRIDVPGEWAGHPLLISAPIGGEARFWINDQELKPARRDGGKHIYEVPARIVSYGGENFLAFRIKADGQQRGMVGLIEYSCPALAGGADDTPPVDVLATPLSPCVVFTPKTDTMHICHSGKAVLYVPGSGRFAVPATEPTTGGFGNWILVWLTPDTPASPQRPILLVFEHKPESVRTEPGRINIKVKQQGTRIVAFRPWI
jgi:hypothetical protein